ncbi:Hcp family type VI secretion system effector [Glacieibacterium megasporae]|uniref:Hcp family type VI secretion system effector n=1 Tax=Glacieibacterium megasporae TaxID=2835787 RepID=UPI001C1DFCE2|nr:type VI secretion system tube protein Hcp [Polymorphobacter megasporae]UAJ09836.1 type VI secretion system tube protein Hcp [Polymorphobacter megasporae]
MAVDMFIKIPGADGESIGHGHTASIDVLAWSWGMSQSGSMHVAKGGGSGKANVQDISFTKYVDKASPKLQLLCLNGKNTLGDAVLTVQKAGEVPVPYVKITFTDFIIASVSTGGSGGEDRLTENVTINFATVKFEYTPQKPDGTADTAVPYTWKIAENVAG